MVVRFHNGVTACPVCSEPVNLSTQSVVRFPEILGGAQEGFEKFAGIYHRACFPRLAEFARIVEVWERYSRECMRQRNHSQSLFNNVVAFDTDRFLCYRYLNSFEHQLFEFPRLLDWHLDADQLRLLYQFCLGLNEDTFGRAQQVFTPTFQFNIDPVQELVEIVRYWTLVLPVTISDADFVALGGVIDLAGDLTSRPQLVDLGHVRETTGVVDRSDDPDFVPDNLQGELLGFAPSQIHEGMINLSVRIHPRDDASFTLWEALELRANLMDYAEALELPWDAEPMLEQGEDAADDEDDSGLPKWE